MGGEGPRRISTRLPGPARVPGPRTPQGAAEGAGGQRGPICSPPALPAPALLPDPKYPHLTLHWGGSHRHQHGGGRRCSARTEPWGRIWRVLLTPTPPWPGDRPRDRRCLSQICNCFPRCCPAAPQLHATVPSPKPAPGVDTVARACCTPSHGQREQPRGDTRRGTRVYLCTVAAAPARPAQLQAHTGARPCPPPSCPRQGHVSPTLQASGRCILGPCGTGCSGTGGLGARPGQSWGCGGSRASKRESRSAERSWGSRGW